MSTSLSKLYELLFTEFSRINSKLDRIEGEVRENTKAIKVVESKVAEALFKVDTIIEQEPVTMDILKDFAKDNDLKFNY